MNEIFEFEVFVALAVWASIGRFFLVDKEILDFSALSLVFVTQICLQMREFEIHKQIK